MVIKTFKVTSVTTFKDLCAAQGIVPQRCFYQLTKKESVSSGKSIIQVSGKKIPEPTSKGKAFVADPAELKTGEMLFIQSTSHNRQLLAGTTALVECVDKAGTGKSATPAPKKLAGKRAAADASTEPDPKKAKTGGCEAKDDKDGWSWYGTLLFHEHGKTKPSSKVAAFDFDGCLANTSLFKKGPDAWSVLFPGETEAVLKDLHRQGYKLVIMTNQSAIGTAKASFAKTVAEKKGRLGGFAKKIGLPCQIFVATDKDSNRKPGKGMWEFMESSKNGGIKVDKKTSFFVGDAAGRKKDHSDSDLKFAKAVGVRFFTEDEMFKEKKYR